MKSRDDHNGRALADGEERDAGDLLKPDRLPITAFLGMGAIAAFLVGIAVIAVYSMADQRSTRHLSAESRDWPRTTATIISSKLHTSQGFRTGTHCTPAITYRYDVKGRPFIGRTIAFHQWTCEQAKHEVAVHAPGEVVDVWYRPADPAVSVLQPNSWDDDGFLAFTGLASLAIVLVAVLFLLPFVGFVLLAILPPSMVKPLLLPLVAAWERRRERRQRNLPP